MAFIHREVRVTKVNHRRSSPVSASSSYYSEPHIFEVGSSADKKAPNPAKMKRIPPPSMLSGDDLLQWQEEGDLLEAIRLSRLKPSSDDEAMPQGAASSSSAAIAAPAPPKSIVQKAAPIRRTHKTKKRQKGNEAMLFSRSGESRIKHTITFNAVLLLCHG